MGQNFVYDLNLTSKIARLAGDLTKFEILEIGPGPGGLTRGLLAEGAQKIIAIEKDKRCVKALKEIQNHYPGRLHIIEGDANKIQHEKYFTKPVKVVANLPYNIGTKLLIDWLTIKDWPPFWHSLTLMKVNPEVFYPAPKVTSAVVQVEALQAPKYFANLVDLEKVVATAFNQRRKMLRSSLRNFVPDLDTSLANLTIDPTARAENLTIEEFCLLANHLKAN